ncbi:MAG TPA: hypothetical protein VK775_17415 [Chthoniobacterales bacterium]|nr:hypothetical protein [Chthoniobacterales bacterium]
MFRNRRFLVFLAGGTILFVCGAALLATWVLTAAKPGQLSWDPPTIRKSVMSFGYKVYANSQIGEGRYFLSKLVLKNIGGRPIRDLTVSYQVPDYIPWTTPEVSSVLPAGTSSVAVYYPKFPERIAHLANQTTASLEIKLQWRDDTGPREQVLRDDFTIYGVNEVQYSDLPADDMLTWYDQWNLAQFIVCMVTPNDPVVKEYAAAITKRLGGTLAGATQDPEQVAELMKATYNYMRETGMRYASAEGVPVSIGDIKTLVQTVRLPRDVITSNNGLCIELAILWASILDQLGCQTYIVMRPGHAFTIVQAGDKYFPVECTAITPKAVGANADVPFEKAVEMATEDLQKQQYKIVYSVQQYRGQGYASPELPDVDTDKVKAMLASREQAEATKNVAQNENQNQGPPQEGGDGAQGQNPPAQAQSQQGMSHFEHSAGLVSFSYPDSWKVLQPPISLGITFRVYDPSTSMGMDVVEVPNANSANDALKAVGRAFARVGSRLRVDDSRRQGDLTVVLGHTVGSSGDNEWFGVFRPVRGGVIGVAAGSPASNFQSNRQVLLQLLDTVHFP